jgi:hypothetical protein
VLRHRAGASRGTTVACAIASALIVACARSTPSAGQFPPGGASPEGAVAEGIPFGLWDLPLDPVDPPGPWTGAAEADSQPESLLRTLRNTRGAGLKAWFRLVGGASNYKDPDTGRFRPDLWKMKMDRHAPYAAQYRPYIEDGTLQGSILLDDLATGNEDDWGGALPTWQEIEETAAYSKQIIPGLATAVRAAPSYLLSIKGSPYESLDAAWAQYTAHRGPVGEYRRSEVAAARAARLGLVVGMNLLDGGSGVPECWPGFSAGRCNMAPQEVVDFGSVLAVEPYACGFLLWHVDAAYFSRPGVMDAIVGLARLARDRPSAPCKQR